jgi:hypothetical protein
VDTPLQQTQTNYLRSDLQLANKCRDGVFWPEKEKKFAWELRVDGERSAVFFTDGEKKHVFKKWMILVCQSSNLKQIIDMKASW